MKKQFLTGVSKIFTSLFLASILFCSAVKAGEKNSGKTNVSELKYVGKIHGQPVFQLNIDNLQQEDLYLSLEDEIGNVLYTEKFNAANYSKKFQFNLSGNSTTKIKMNLSTKTNRQTQVFEINNVQTFVEDVVVKKA